MKTVFSVLKQNLLGEGEYWAVADIFNHETALAVALKLQKTNPDMKFIIEGKSIAIQKNDKTIATITEEK
jgi:hypothetical protein